MKFIIANTNYMYHDTGIQSYTPNLLKLKVRKQPDCLRKNIFTCGYTGCVQTHKSIYNPLNPQSA